MDGLLAVEEFNKKIMNPELSEEAMQCLHNDAITLYNLHFKPDAEHKVPVSIDYVNEIKSSKLYMYLSIPTLLDHSAVMRSVFT